MMVAVAGSNVVAVAGCVTGNDSRPAAPLLVLLSLSRLLPTLLSVRVRCVVPVRSSAPGDGAYAPTRLGAGAIRGERGDCPTYEKSEISLLGTAIYKLHTVYVCTPVFLIDLTKD